MHTYHVLLLPQQVVKIASTRCLLLGQVGVCGLLLLKLCLEALNFLGQIITHLFVDELLLLGMHLLLAVLPLSFLFLLIGATLSKPSTLPVTVYGFLLLLHRAPGTVQGNLLDQQRVAGPDRATDERNKDQR